MFGRYEKAVKASKARKGEAVERAEKLREVIHPMDAYGMSQRAIEDALNAAVDPTQHGSNGFIA